MIQLLDRMRRGLGSSIAGISESRRAERISSEGPISGMPSNIPPRFRIREKLGQGGMGAVFRAYDLERGHDVALKSLTRLNPDDLYRLKNEFRALTQIRHPNLVHLYELFVENSEGFFTMELVTGSDFIDFVRAEDGDRCDYDKLRDAGRQLALAIRAVHAAGKLHRDIKPSNIRVTTSERVVLLDFGLADPLSEEIERTHAAGAIVGTIEYMPPEQARGEALGPAADWYGFGVTLFEAITRRLPIERPLQWLLGDEKSAVPLRVRDLAPDVPDDIEALVTSLLARAPEARQTGVDVLRTLAGDAVPLSISPMSAAALPPKLPFDGRDEDLRRLSDALAQSEEGNTVVVHVRGPSGIGKTELVRRFTERAQREGAIVLSGRCHPRESVAFNALDGVVDDLSRELERWTREEVASVLPRRANALPRLFPVLGRIPAIDDAEGEAIDSSAHDALREAVQALKELLASLTDRRQLILWLDDVQWGDRDSGRLLRDLLSAPDPPALLVVLSYREDGAAASQMLAELDASRGSSMSVELELALSPLSDEQTLALVQRFVGDTWAGSADELRRLAREAEGIPFFVHELARFLTSETAAHVDISSLRLSDLLLQRVRELPEEARRILEIVSVSGGALDHRSLFRAIGTTSAAHDALANLERKSLVQSSTADRLRLWEVYHHRIRDVVLESLEEPTKQRHHHAIADAMLTTDEPNLPQVVEHYEAAGDLDAVRRYLMPAARRATDLLAFARAAELYKRAIELGCADVAEHELHERLGDALSSAGRGAEAGRVLERAAELASESGQPADGVLNLRRRAATEYLRSWQRDDAMRILGTIARPLGIGIPKHVGTALAEAVVNRMNIGLRRKLRRGAPPARKASREVTERLDITELMMKVAANTEPALGFAFGSRLLKEALDVGDPDLVFRGLCCEGVAWAAIDTSFAQRIADSHMTEARALLAAHPNPLHRAWLLQCEGHVSFFRGEFRASFAYMADALERYRVLRRAHSVDYANALAFYLPTSALLGQMTELRAEMDALLGDASGRGDEYLIATCAAGNASLGWIVTGRVAEARHWAERVLSLSPPRFSTQRYLHLTSTSLIALYEDRAIQASEALERAWPEVVQSRFLDIAAVGDDLRALRGRVAIAAAMKHAASGRGVAAERLLGVALAEAAHIERDGSTYAGALAKLLRAGVHGVRGDEPAAHLALAAALPALDANEAEFFAASCRRALGRARPDEGRRAEAWMQQMGIVDPDAAARLCVPGCL